MRNLLSARAASAGLSPELEKPGLLPPQLEESGQAAAGAPEASTRRPADVWVPAWGLHGAAAFELAVTSGMRSAVVAASAGDGAHAAQAYEERKRTHLGTETQCRREGLQFVPLVAEACGGGWGPASVRTWRALGALMAARTGEAASVVTEHLHQALSVTLQRENARAVLRRLPEGLPDCPGTLDAP